MTHITPQQAREMAGLALDHGTMAGVVESLADQVDAAVNAGHIAVEICGKLIAERDALKAQAERDAAAIKWATEQVVGVIAERDSLKADAERYRWLIDNCGFGIRRNGVHELTVAFLIKQPNNISDLNDAIDAARAAS